MTCLRAGFPVSGAADEFRPAEMAGLALWLDGADAGTLFQDDSRATAATGSLDPVGGWRDKGPAGRHPAQASSTKRPSLILGAGGRNLVRFDGIDDCLAFSGSGLSLLRNLAGYTVFAATSIRTSGVSQTLLAGYTPAPTLFAALSHGTGNAAQFFGRRSFADAAGQGWTLGTASTVGTLEIVTHRLDAAHDVVEGWRNGTSKASFSPFEPSGAGAPLTDTALGSLYLGSGNGTSYLSGDVAELLVYARALSDADRAVVESYLRAKWGTA